MEDEKRTEITVAAIALLLIMLAILVLGLGGKALEQTLTGLMFAGIVLAAAAIYLLPMIVAENRKHHQRGAIAVINILLGWTVIGWIVALAMAASEVRPRSQA